MMTSSTSAASMPARCDGVLDRVAAQRGAVRHVESALPALGQGVRAVETMTAEDMVSGWG
jgi:hypothetical protein